MAKFCTECGHALTEETTVCPECGTRVQNSASPSPEKKAEAQRAIPTENRQAAEVCPKCGTPYRPGVQFCTECGTRRAQSPAAAPVNPNPANANPVNPNPANANPIHQANANPVNPNPANANPVHQANANPVNPNPANANPIHQANANPVNPRPANANPNTVNPNPVHANPAPMGVPYTPAPVAAAEDDMPRGGAYGVVSTGAFFWLDVLFKLPGLGWLFCIILSFAPKNYNIKHFARSKLVVLVIALICAGLAYAFFAIFGDQIAAALQSFVSDLLS